MTKPQSFAPRRILVIRLRYIGDAILATPAIAALKKRFPSAAIDFLAEPPAAEALEGNPHLNDILVYKAPNALEALRWLRRVRDRRYDCVIDFMGTPRSALLTLASGAPARLGYRRIFYHGAYTMKFTQLPADEYVGREYVRVTGLLGVPTEGQDFIPRVYLAKFDPSRASAVGLVPAARRETRSWPLGHYAEIGRLVRDRLGLEVLVFWGPGEREIAQEVLQGIGAGASLASETKTLRCLAQEMTRCRLIVANCTGPKHMAVGLGIPTVTIHGGSDPVFWNPPLPQHAVVRRDELFCIGCRLDRCPYHLECLEGLPPRRAFEAVERLLLQRTAA